MNTSKPGVPNEEGLEQVLRIAHDGLLQYIRSVADPAQAMAAIMDRFQVLDDSPPGPVRLIVPPARAAATIRSRLSVLEARAKLARVRTHCLTIHEGLDHVLTRPAWWEDREYNGQPAIRSDLESLASRVFFTACPDRSDLLLFTDDEREFLAEEPLRGILPSIAHDLEVMEIQLESAVTRLRHTTETDGWVSFSHLRRARHAVVQLTKAVEVTAEIIGTIAGALDLIIVDASGADLSSLRLPDVDVLDGVRWTRAAAHVHDTIWPTGLTIRVLESSEEIAPGVYQVRLGTQEVPVELART